MSKPKRKPASFWRELSMLREKGIFWKCLDKKSAVIPVSVSYLILLSATAAIVTESGFRDAVCLGAAIGIGIHTISCLLLFVTIPVLVSRKSILRPAYHRRELANAQAEFNLAMQELEASLPSTHYRIAPTEDLQASTARLRAYTDNNQLSADQRSRLARVEAAKERLEEAEQEFDLIASSAK